MQPDKWCEARLKRGAKPMDLYNWLGEEPASVHHFWDEPWWERAYVVRVLNPAKPLAKCPAVDHVVVWDSEPDEEQYGGYWFAAARFFEAGSLLAAGNKDPGRFVHCYLNANGLSHYGEARWALRYAWRIFKTGVLWKLYLERRWKRESGPPVKDTDAGT